MRILNVLFCVSLAFIFSCNSPQNNASSENKSEEELNAQKKKELEKQEMDLKEKEIELKKAELDKKENDLNKADFVDRSSIVSQLLIQAHTRGVQFRVIIVDSRPKLEGFFGLWFIF